MRKSRDSSGARFVPALGLTVHFPGAVGALAMPRCCGSSNRIVMLDGFIPDKFTID